MQKDENEQMELMGNSILRKYNKTYESIIPEDRINKSKILGDTTMNISFKAIMNGRDNSTLI